MSGVCGQTIGSHSQGMLVCDALSLAAHGANEDYVAIGSVSFCMADGMGGCELGAAFARLVSEVCVASMESGATVGESSHKALTKVKTLREDCRLTKGGAAFFAGKVQNGAVEAAWAGDVVAFCLDGDGLVALNEPDRAACGGLSKHAGISGDVSGYLSIPASPQMRVLVCTDGLWENTPRDVLRDTLVDARTPREATTALLFGRQLPDDASALVLFGGGR